METNRADRPNDLYETDFYSWTAAQADCLRAGRFDEADLLNIIEEIETLGRSEAASLESAYLLIALHLLKRLVQADRADSRSWTNTIIRERNDAARIIRHNPGLKSRRLALFEDAYADARKEAASEMGLKLATFPVKPPFTLDEALDEGFLGRLESRGVRPIHGGDANEIFGLKAGAADEGAVDVCHR